MVATLQRLCVSIILGTCKIFLPEVLVLLLYILRFYSIMCSCLSFLEDEICVILLAAVEGVLVHMFSQRYFCMGLFFLSPPDKIGSGMKPHFSLNLVIICLIVLSFSAYILLFGAKFVSRGNEHEASVFFKGIERGVAAAERGDFYKRLFYTLDGPGPSADRLRQILYEEPFYPCSKRIVIMQWFPQLVEPVKSFYNAMKNQSSCEVRNVGTFDHANDDLIPILNNTDIVIWVNYTYDLEKLRKARKAYPNQVSSSKQCPQKYKM